MGTLDEFAGSGDDETEEEARVVDDVSLVVPARDLLDLVAPSPLPSVVNEIYKAFKMLEANR